MALIPTFAVSADADGVVVNLYDAGTSTLILRDDTPVKLSIDTLYPANGYIRIAVKPPGPKSFAVKLRIPAWCRDSSVQVNGKKIKLGVGLDGYTSVLRNWKPGDQIELNLKLEPRMVAGDLNNPGKAALLYGPLVLAADETLLPPEFRSLTAVTAASPDLATLAVTPEPAPGTLKGMPTSQVYRIRARDRKTGAVADVRLIPFAEAGATGTSYKIWLRLPNQPNANLLLDGVESRSRQGNLAGSINDDDPLDPVVTYDGNTAKEDWFAVTLDSPVKIRRVSFTHGRSFHDGGWFDASAAKPKVQIQREKDGPWETVGELGDYLATTATTKSKLTPGMTFSLRLSNPVNALAVRVLGVPACGDNPNQAFASCAELQAFTE